MTHAHMMLLPSPATLTNLISRCSRTELAVPTIQSNSPENETPQRCPLEGEPGCGIIPAGIQPTPIHPVITGRQEPPQMRRTQIPPGAGGASHDDAVLRVILRLVLVIHLLCFGQLHWLRLHTQHGHISADHTY